LNGVLQAPGSSYTVSGSTITFASNLVTGDVINFIHILGSVLDLGVPSDGTVSGSKLSATAITGQTAETSVADDDLVLLSDTSASAALKKMTVSNLVANAGGGKIGQVVSSVKTTSYELSSGTFTDVTGYSVDITPSATSSKVLVIANFQAGQDSDGGFTQVRMLRGSTVINAGGASASRTPGIVGANWGAMEDASGFIVATCFLDSPNTTSSTTYKIQVRQTNSNTLRVGVCGNDGTSSNNVISASVLTVMEVLA